MPEPQPFIVGRQSEVERFAAQGYLTVAPDLYRGKVATEAELAHELSRGLPQERAVRDMVELLARPL